jgi:hypothetical protein
VTASTRQASEPTGALRTGILALAGLGAVGGLIELATLRHWGSALRMIPWVVLIVLLATVVIVAWRPTRVTLATARGLGVVALLATGFGIYEHIRENYSTAPLDQKYGDVWESMSFASRIWHAMNGSVGPSPLLAPALLAQVGLCLILATIGHPVLTARLADRADRADRLLSSP